MPILPSLESFSHISPIVQILSILTIGIGLPFFLLSTTSTLVQQKAQSYHLYAFSNFGSLLALLAYPFFVEPNFSLKMQASYWNSIFVLFCILMSLCMLFAQKQKQEKMTTVKAKFSIKWLLFPAISSIVLLTSTRELTTFVAPVPFLWILPLAIYLLSFIVSFRGSSFVVRNWHRYLFLLTFTTILFTRLSQFHLNLPITLILFSLFLFSSFIICHGELYMSRPQARSLHIFYLFLAAGSVVGSVIVALITPNFLRQSTEFYMGMFGIYSLCLYGFFRDKNSRFWKLFFRLFPTNRERYLFGLLIFFSFFIGGGLTKIGDTSPSSLKKYYRNFYGELSIWEKRDDKGPLRSLHHGTILHGIQAMEGDRRFQATSYYGQNSAVGFVLRSSDGSRNIAAVGLGTGTVATYTKPGDNLRFFEINPYVVDIANNDFEYLKNAKGNIEIVLGDGRLKLAEERGKNTYDVIILDAFSDDAIPMHLLTDEAFSLYRDLLKNNRSIIAVHISNSYVDLAPVLVNIAKKYNFSLAFLRSPADQENLVNSAEWVLLSLSEEALLVCVDCKKDSPAYEKAKDLRLWTDDYSNILQLLK